MEIQQLVDGSDLVINCQVYDTYDGPMWQTANKDKLAKVFVLGHEDTVVIQRRFHNHLVRSARIDRQD
jgi:hypothetical protein